MFKKGDFVVATRSVGRIKTGQKGVVISKSAIERTNQKTLLLIIFNDMSDNDIFGNIYFRVEDLKLDIDKIVENSIKDILDEE